MTQKNLFSRLFLSFSLVLATGTFALAKHTPEAYSKFVIFGDSLNDTGNNTWVTPPKSQRPQTGAPITHTDKNGQRYLWVNYLAQTWNITNGTITPSTQSTHPSTESVNYAWASAQTSDTYADHLGTPNPACTQGGKTIAEGECIPGLIKQVDLFLAQQQSPDPQALYIIAVGANDLGTAMSSLIGKMITGQKPGVDTFMALVATPVNNMHLAIQKLKHQGIPADHILVLNVPDFSKTPATQTLLTTLPIKPFFKTWVMTAIEDLIATFNTYAELQLGKMDEVKFFHTDVLFNEVLEGKTSIVNTTDRCDQNLSALDNHCAGYLFYDDKHPSTDMGKIMAERVAGFLAE